MAVILGIQELEGHFFTHMGHASITCAPVWAFIFHNIHFFAKWSGFLQQLHVNPMAGQFPWLASYSHLLRLPFVSDICSSDSSFFLFLKIFYLSWKDTFSETDFQYDPAYGN